MSDVELLRNDTDLTPEEVRRALVNLHNAVVQGLVTKDQAAQANKSLETYAKISGMMVQEQAAERKTTPDSFNPG